MRTHAGSCWSAFLTESLRQKGHHPAGHSGWGWRAPSQSPWQLKVTTGDSGPRAGCSREPHPHPVSRAVPEIQAHLLLNCTQPEATRPLGVAARGPPPPPQPATRQAQSVPSASSRPHPTLWSGERLLAWLLKPPPCFPRSEPATRRMDKTNDHTASGRHNHPKRGSHKQPKHPKHRLNPALKTSEN